MTTIGQRYILHNLLGEGGMGVVYRATDRLTGQQVALKKVTVPLEQLHFSSRGAADYVIALSREFSILGTLRHPYIVSVLDYGFDGENLPYLTMTLLEDAVPLNAVNADDATKVGLLSQVLQALVYLHRRGVLHRDLKSANVLVVDAVAYVVDFGLALGFGEDPGYGGGTLAYMAPELIHAQPPSIASDLYALGLMAFELFSGYFPYDADGPSEALVNQILSETPDLNEVPPYLQDWLGALLAKHPDQRPPSALAALNDLLAAVPFAIELDGVALRESFLEAATFVGREAEFDQLLEAAAAMHTGQGGFWLVSGESGVGKTRLLHELRIRELVAGAAVIQGNASGMRLQLWRDVLPPLLLQVAVSDAEAAVLHELVPHIEQLLGHPLPPMPALEPIEAIHRLYDTIVGVLQRVNQPLLLIAEDLHADAANVPILQRLAPRLPHQPLLVVGSFRTDETPYLAEWFPTAHTLHLERFDPAAITALSASMLGDSGRRQEVVGLLQQETEGNALFIVEVLRALAEEAGGFFAVGQVSLPGFLVSGGVQAVLERRLAQMEPNDQALLRLAAVAGRRLDLQVLARLAGAIDLEGWLLRGSAVAIFEVRHNQWQFSHDRLRDALLTTLEADERAWLHGQVADAIVETYPDQLDQLSLTLTDHYQAAGDVVNEMAFAQRVAQQMYRFPLPHAQRVLTRWLEHQPYLAPTPVLWMRLNDLRRRLALGDTAIEAEVLVLLHEADTATDANLPLGVAALLLEWANATDQPLDLVGLGAAALTRNELGAAHAYLRHAIALALQRGDLAQRIHAMTLLASVYARLGELDKAERTLIDALDLVEPLDAPAAYQRVCYQCALLALHFGAVEAAAGWAERCVQLGPSPATPTAYLVWGVAALIEGHRQQALAALRWVRDRANGQTPPHDLVARIGLGLLGDDDLLGALEAYCTLGYYGDATQVYEQWLCVQTLAQLGDMEAALAALTQALG